MNRNIKLSICIPTKNRQEYCKAAILTILDYKQEYFELIIQDNSDDNSLEKFVANINDCRLKYVYTKEKLSSTANMDFSIKRSIGNYVCMIGDDDIVSPGIFEAIDYMIENDVDSVCSSYHSSYDWPNPKINTKGTFKIIEFRNQSFIKYIDVNQRLELLFKNGIIDYQQYYLPRVYHGIIRRDVLDKIYAEVGCYFRALSPDIYSTIALSTKVKNHIVLNLPISVPGSCPKSTTSENQNGGHRGELSDCPHLKYRDDYVWDEMIPRFYSVETIWAESAMKAAKDFKLDSLINLFNSNRFNIVALARSKSIKQIIFRELYLESFLSKSILLIQAQVFIGLNFIKRAFIKVFLKKPKEYDNVSHIAKVLNML